MNEYELEDSVVEADTRTRTMLGATPPDIASFRDLRTAYHNGVPVHHRTHEYPLVWNAYLRHAVWPKCPACREPVLVDIDNAEWACSDPECVNA